MPLVRWLTNRFPFLGEGPRVWVTQAYLFSLATVFLLLCGPAGYTRITRFKFMLFTCLSGGYVLAMAALSLPGLARRRGPGIKAALRRVTWPQWAAAAYLLATWVSALASPYWPHTFLGVSRYEGAASITLYVLSFLLISAYGKPTRLLLGALAGAMVVFGGLCALQLAGRNPFGLYPQGLTYADAYVAYPGAYLGTIGNVGLVAGFFSLSLPMLVYALIRLPARGRFWLLLPLALCLYALVRMHVLAGFVGVGMGTLLALPVAGFRKGRQRASAALAMGCALLAALELVYLVDAGAGLFHEVHQILHGNFDAGFGTGRLYIWQEVLARVPQRLWLGYGPDTMLRAGMQFRHYNALLGRQAVSSIDMAHSEPLNVLYHQGLLGLVTYIIFLASLARRWISAAPHNGAIALLGAGLLGYALQGLFGYSMPITAPFFWAAAGLLACPSPPSPPLSRRPLG